MTTIRKHQICVQERRRATAKFAVGMIEDNANRGTETQ